MGLLKRFRMPSCSRRRLFLLLLLQIVVLICLLGPLFATEEFYAWLDRRIVFPGDRPDGCYGGSPDSGAHVPTGQRTGVVELELLQKKGIMLPAPNELSKKFLHHNTLPPRNLDLFPSLPEDHVIIVLYVHKRPEYLRLAIAGLSEVEGIDETLLIVSHDGYYDEMNAIVEGVRFCQVKQIYAPWSPHIFPDTFPGVTPGDCKDKDDAAKMKCNGNPDQYGNHRGVRIVSLKHHWWWMMNTIWDGLVETEGFRGHIMFIEEDHYLLPNAYRNIQLLTKWKQEKCPYCIAANVAPLDVKSRGERVEHLFAEKVGNVGYTFNRSVWERIHAQAKPFCTFDDYNWDITMWATIYPTFGDALYTLRGPRASAIHFGRCGLHEGHTKSTFAACQDNGLKPQAVENKDRVPSVKRDWKVHKYPLKGYSSGFKGWGGWGDVRDQQLCLNFASMYSGLQQCIETVVLVPNKGYQRRPEARFGIPFNSYHKP